MAYIRHIPPSRASGRLAHIYREIRNEVPRVPNLMQVFSLRPETMRSIYRSWLASMWNGTVPRQTKELVAVAVSKVTNCDYCVDAHMVFLQAACIDRAKAYEIEGKLADASVLDTRERTTLAFAVRLSRDPRLIGPAEVAELAAAWPDPIARRWSPKPNGSTAPSAAVPILTPACEEWPPIGLQSPCRLS